MVELYWMSLLRDVDFRQYGAHPLAAAAAAELGHLSDFRGPRQGSLVTAQTLFRDDLPGCLTGPYVSQFMWLDTPFGAEAVTRRMRTLLPRTDQVTTFADWLAVQNGFVPGKERFDPLRRYIRNGRDLAQWVHIDVLFQAYFHAMLIMLAGPDANDAESSGLGVPFDAGNPYHASANQDGFGTFGGPHIAALMCEVATRALKIVFYFIPV